MKIRPHIYKIFFSHRLIDREVKQMEITSQQAVDLDIRELMARFGTDVYRTCFLCVAAQILFQI